MSDPANSLSRRDLLSQGSQLAAASALAGLSAPLVHAGENNTVQVALVGCGGRGTGAAENALRTTSGPIKLVAMADVFNQRLATSYYELNKNRQQQVDVPEDRKFIGFDGYKKAMDCLKKGDVVILATPPAFRWVQFTYAIQKGLHVFMEKPISVDGPSSRRMLALGAESVKKNLKVGVGLMCRHCTVRKEMIDRIRAGAIGDIIMMRAYRQAGPTGHANAAPKPWEMSELMYQIKGFHGFLWASGGAFSDFLIHNIDECCWFKGAWPVKAQGSGGRHYRHHYVDQNFDTYSTEYTFADGSKLFLEGRTMDGCHTEFASYVHGAKGSGVISAAGHSPARCRFYKGQAFVKENLIWEGPKREPSPYQLEWDNLIKAIREDKPHNEVQRGAEASLVTAMGRMACHTGRVVTYDQALNHEHEFAPDVDKLALDSPAPLRAGPDGKYPVPQPGIKTKREY